MNPECGKPWTRKHIRDAFTLVFINGPLCQHKEQVLFDKERALLPATQSIVEGKIEAKKIQKEIHDVYTQITALRDQINQLEIAKRQAENRRPRLEARAFVRACPAEDCRGFLSSQWKCGVCEKWTCPDCHVLKGYTRDAEHTCNEDDVATARLLAADTKPCPKCATGIFKIDGCDQMWCTQCHTAFSWRTGRIEERIHNPHYYEWRRRTGGGEMPRDPLDTPCGRNLDHHLYEAFSRMLRHHYTATQNYRGVLKQLDEIIRYGTHMLLAERHGPVNYERRNEDLRVRYLMNEITMEDMRLILQRDEKRNDRNQEISDVYTLLCTTVTDILFRFLHYLDTMKGISIDRIDTTLLDEIKTIVEYANECLIDIARTYSSAKNVVNYNLAILRGQSAIEFIAMEKEKKKGPFDSSAAVAVAASAESPITNEFI